MQFQDWTQGLALCFVPLVNRALRRVMFNQAMIVWSQCTQKMSADTLLITIHLVTLLHQRFIDKKKLHTNDLWYNTNTWSSLKGASVRKTVHKYLIHVCTLHIVGIEQILQNKTQWHNFCWPEPWWKKNSLFAPYADLHKEQSLTTTCNTE